MKKALLSQPMGGKTEQEIIETRTMGEKTTVVRCVLRNGFEIWELLGFMLQTAWHGIQ